MTSTARTVTFGLAAIALFAAAWLFYRKSRPTGARSDGSPVIEINTHADDGTEIPPEVAAALQAVAADKSVALNNATVTVHRAYEYTGPATIEPIGTAKRIAVDATFSGYTERFKIWDVDIIDGKTDENFGSDPEVAFLDATGGFVSYEGKNIDFTKPIRLLMVFAVPKCTTMVKLGYWGRDLTRNPVPLEDHGMALPSRN